MPLWEMKEVKEAHTYNMAGTISEKGRLWISRKRKGKLEKIPQYCPYCNGENEVLYCGDFCPLFGEIEPSIIENATIIINGKEEKSKNPITVYSIPICNGKILRFYNLKDLREATTAEEEITTSANNDITEENNQ